MRAAAVAEGGVKGDGGLVIVIGGSRAYAAPPYLAGLAARRAGVHGVRIAAPPAAAAQEAALEVHLIPVAGPELGPLAIREAAGASAQMTRKLAEAPPPAPPPGPRSPGPRPRPRPGEPAVCLHACR